MIGGKLGLIIAHPVCDEERKEEAGEEESINKFISPMKMERKLGAVGGAG